MRGGAMRDYSDMIGYMNRIMDEAREAQINTLQKIRDIEIQGVAMEIWRATGCEWNRITFVIGGQTVYDLKRVSLTGDGYANSRQEFFNGTIVRTYEGRQNCFVEFCGEIDRFEFPSRENFAVAREALGLSSDVLVTYQTMYREMFEGKGKPMDEREKPPCFYISLFRKSGENVKKMHAVLIEAGLSTKFETRKYRGKPKDMWKVNIEFLGILPAREKDLQHKVAVYLEEKSVLRCLLSSRPAVKRKAKKRKV
jgi:hypothetical protein